MFVVNFIAHYWWVWLIITICCFGIFLTNLTASPAAREALREAMRAADHRRQQGDGDQQQPDEE